MQPRHAAEKPLVHDLDELDAVRTSAPPAAALLSLRPTMRLRWATNQVCWQELEDLVDTALYHLQLRHAAGIPYTYLGPAVLVAIGSAPAHVKRPADFFNRLPVLGAPPHPFGMADRMYREMRAGGGAQMVVLTGVSGSGKSAAARQLLQHWSSLHSGSNMDATCEDSDSSKHCTPGEQLLCAADLLGQFISAKTARTADSSRAGRVYSACFSDSGRLVGGKLEVLPMERTRVLGPAAADRSYHIFYQLCFGASCAERERLQLQQIRSYSLLNRSSCFIAGTRDEDDYVRTVRQLQQLGFGPSERRAINAAVAAVLFAGNLQFTADSISGGTTCGAPGTRSLQALNSLGAALGVRADELEVVLTTREISTRHHARGEPAVSCRVTLPPETAQLYRDTLVQLLFTALVQWLTTRVNTALFTPRSREMASRATLAVVDGYGFDRAERSSGFSNLLSNYAFERMASLYYEVNVWSPLRGQASDGLAEVSPADLTAIAGGMADKDVRGGGSMLPNPADIVQLVDGRPEGILALVDKAGAMPKASDRALLERLHAVHATAASAASLRDGHGGSGPSVAAYRRPALSRASFTIVHGCGPVDYSVTGALSSEAGDSSSLSTGFLQSNRLWLGTPAFGKLLAATSTEPSGAMRELGQLLSSAGAGRDVLSAGTDSNKAQKETGKHRTVATMTAGRAFKAALGRIVDAASIAASAGGLKWLLCIRPGHHQQVPGDFDLRYVAQQLTGLGVNREVTARRVGFPIAIPTEAFYETYRRLFPILRPLTASTMRAAVAAEEIDNETAANLPPGAAWQMAAKAREACRCLLTVLRLPPESWAVGERRVHLSAAAFRKLHARQHHLARVRANRALRDSGWLARRRAAAGERRAACVVGQSYWRGFAARATYLRVRQAILIIQRQLRRRWRRRAVALVGGWNSTVVGPQAPLLTQLAAARGRQLARLLPPKHELETGPSIALPLVDLIRVSARLLRDAAALDQAVDSGAITAGSAATTPTVMYSQWMHQTVALTGSSCAQRLLATRNLFEVAADVQSTAGAHLSSERNFDRLSEFCLLEADIWHRTLRFATAQMPPTEVADTCGQQPDGRELATLLAERAMTLKRQAEEQVGLYAAQVEHWTRVSLASDGSEIVSQKETASYQS